MTPRRRSLRIVDGIVNLLLGVALLLFPAGLIELLGLPTTATYFYTSILGGVIFGIGVALLMGLKGESRRLQGLALGGALAINLCGGGVLVYWLLFGQLVLPLRGYLVLWVVTLTVLVIAAAELVTVYRGESARVE